MDEAAARMVNASNQDRRTNQTLEQQAHEDSAFLDHPGRFLGNLATNQGGRMAPAVAAFLANPAIGAIAAGGQTSHGMAEDAGQRFDQATQGMSGDQLAAVNPLYAQLRQQGMSDDAARDQLRQQAQASAAQIGMVGGTA